MISKAPIMNRSRFLVILCASLFASGAHGALKLGEAAPDFSVPAAIGGKDFNFSLSESLKKGPVVVYFYPKSFTRGCTIEAHEFAENYEKFADAGATLIGLSSDTIETQREFSTKECRDKFPVAADPSLSVIKSYDAKRDRLSPSGETLADRISYVISPEGKIVYAFVDANPIKHVENTLDFVKKWREAHAH
jgi:thioredoxin-dependent peroxiredoxin